MLHYINRFTTNTHKPMNIYEKRISEIAKTTDRSRIRAIENTMFILNKKPLSGMSQNELDRTIRTAIRYTPN